MLKALTIFVTIQTPKTLTKQCFMVTPGFKQASALYVKLQQLILG